MSKSPQIHTTTIHINIKIRPNIRALASIRKWIGASALVHVNSSCTLHKSLRLSSLVPILPTHSTSATKNASVFDVENIKFHMFKFMFHGPSSAILPILDSFCRPKATAESSQIPLEESADIPQIFVQISRCNAFSPTIRRLCSAILWRGTSHPGISRRI